MKCLVIVLFILCVIWTCFVFLAKFGFARIKFGTFIKLIIATYSINLIID